MGFHPSLSLLASHCDRRTCLSHASVCSNPITNARENTMVIGIGTDILRTSRLDPSTLVPGDAFFERAFTSTEREQAMHAANRHEYLMARFCAKEAAYKAISLCQEEFHPGDFEILDDEGGHPHVRLLGRTKQMVWNTWSDDVQLLVSVSHEDGLVSAFALAQTMN